MFCGSHRIHTPYVKASVQYLRLCHVMLEIGSYLFYLDICIHNVPITWMLTIRQNTWYSGPPSSQAITPFSVHTVTFIYPVVSWTVGAPQMTWQRAPSIPLASQPSSWRAQHHASPFRYVIQFTLNGVILITKLIQN